MREKTIILKLHPDHSIYVDFILFHRMIRMNLFLSDWTKKFLVTEVRN